MKDTPFYGSKDDQLKGHMVKPSQAKQFGGEAYVYSEMQARVMVIAALESAQTKQEKDHG